ncbi:MAG TPA: zinc ribbon domain-containing protein [Pyrinomonadaceae bacterium]|nr:zinc ribbon domain-containing protein [Pyrinomonadaceae bacterium]
MFCPQCGQQQVSREVRFCSSCGFPMNFVQELLATNGVLVTRAPEPVGPRKISPRQKGVRQGVMLMLMTLLLVPLSAILGVFIFNAPEVVVPITAITCFVGGFLRIMYALLFEEGSQSQPVDYLPSYAPPTDVPAYMHAPPRVAATLNPQRPTPAPSYRQPRFNTGELVQRPPSVTENTTRLLKDEDRPEDPSAR